MEDVDPILEVHRRHVLTTVREALDELDESDRQLLLARYCDEHAAEALAERLGIPASTVRSRLSRATARVRRSLDERWGGDRRAWAPAVAAIPMSPREAGSTTLGWSALVMAAGKKIGVALVAVVVASAAWFGYQHMRGSTDTPAAPTVADERAELLARKRLARGTAAPDRSPGSLSGQVREAGTGRPVGGAVVLVVSALGSGVVRGGPGLPAVRPRTRTNAQGEFSASGLPPGRYRLSASMPGFLPTAQSNVSLAAGTDQSGVILEVVAGGNQVDGTVRDIGGGPVEGAFVHAQTHRPVVAASGGQLGYGAVTDAEGHYVLTVPDGTWKLTAGGDDYTADSRTVRVEHGPGRADFDLVPGAAIIGRVVARATGEPVAGARVGFNVDIRRGGRTTHRAGDPEQVAFSDDAGRFRLRPLEPGQYSLYANAPGLASAATTVVHAAIGEELTNIEVLIDPAFDARGFVVDAHEPERGLGGVQVMALVMPGRRQMVTQTEPDGHFELLGLIPGSYMLMFDGEGLLSSGFEHSLQIDDRDPDDMLVELERGTQIRGRVEPPVAGRIEVSNRKDRGGLELMLAAAKLAKATANIQADGSFVIDTVPAGAWKLLATGDDGSQGQLEIEIGEAGLDDAVIALTPRSKVTGSVRNAGGEPVPGLTVTLEGAGGPARNFPGMQGRRSAGAGVTAADGGFVVWGVDAGTYTVAVHDAAGQAVEVSGAAGTPPAVEAVAGLDVTEFDLQVTLPRGVIAGRVLGPEGQPMVDAWVTVRGGDSASSWGGGTNTTITDTEGAFAFEGLAMGSFDVLVRGPDSETRGKVEDVAPNGGPVEVRLESLGEIRGVVTRGGEAVTRFALDGGRASRRTIVSDDGSFVLRRLEPREQRITVTTKTGSAFAHVDLEPGATVEVRLELAEWGSAEGTLVSAVDGTPLMGITIDPDSDGGLRARDKSMLGAMMGGGGIQTDDAGHFRVEGLGAGAAALRFSHGSRMRGAERLGGHGFTLAAGEHAELGTIIVLPPANVPSDEQGWLGLTVDVRATAPGAHAPAGTTPVDTAASKVWISWVEPSGPAGKTGLVLGDRILEVGGLDEDKVGLGGLSAALGQRRIQVGQSYTVKVERDGEPRTVTMRAVAPPKG